jgi:8-oxo-dGTP diphosphatase
VRCVGGIVVDGDGRLLLVRRGNQPAKGTWSIPGGRVEPGECDAVATAREVLEETGLRVRVGRLAGAVERDAPGGAVYAIRDYLCTPAEGADLAGVHAGDDATEVAWVTPGQLPALDTSPGLVEALTEWGILQLFQRSTTGKSRS